MTWTVTGHKNYEPTKTCITTEHETWFDARDELSNELDQRLQVYLDQVAATQTTGGGELIAMTELIEGFVCLHAESITDEEFCCLADGIEFHIERSNGNKKRGSR